MCPKNTEARLKRLEAEVKRIKDILEISPTITDFNDWTSLTERDKTILNYLLSKQREGASLSELANALNLSKPDTTGKVIVHRCLKRIEKISQRVKGFPLVVSDRRKWYLNYDEFQFISKK